ncbi:MAG: GAF domain-containing protein [Aquificae bacterium]|nr:GAF domain-containing protein [Aquificota bacterium]
MVKKRLRLKTEELRIINEVLKGILKHRSLEKLLDFVLKTFYSLWNVEHSFIALYDPKIGELRVKSAFGFLPKEVERAIYSKGEGITGQTYKLGIPLFATEDELLNKTGLLERIPYRDFGFFTAPIKAGSEVVGVVGLFKDLRLGPTSVEKTLEILSVIGSILGTFLYLQKEFEKEKKLLEERGGSSLLREKEIAKYGLIGVSEALERLKNLLKQLEGTDVNLLIKGKDGVGKTLVAKVVHLTSQRRDKPLQVLDLRNTPRNLVEIELFGFEGNRYQPFKPGLLELADGGTLIIKHVELLPVEVQRKLLDFLRTKTARRVGSEEDRKFNVRILATTSDDLLERVRRGSFLRELYDQLSLVTVEVPSLAERREDVPLLVNHFLKKYGTRYGKAVSADEELVRFLTLAELKENVKELDRLIHRLVLLSPSGKKLTVEDLRLVAPYLFEGKEVFTPPAPLSDLPLPKKIEEEEKQKIVWALEKTNFVKSRAAKLLGYTLRQLDYRIKKYGIEVPKRKKGGPSS